MIFFGIPSVGHLKPETFFGNDDHYGFIQTLVGEEYDRTVVNRKCSEYYETENAGYWDRIITIPNFLGIKKIDDENRFSRIPFLDYVTEKFDVSDYRTAHILFDYLLCQWQYPHPIVTKTNTLDFLDLKIINPRKNCSIFKPYILILEVLRELYLMSSDLSYFTKEEFCWLTYKIYEVRCSNEFINDKNYLAKSILEIRKNKWPKFNSINKSKRPYLSYPLGFLRNSSVLTHLRTEYNQGTDFFIGLKKSESILDDIESLINNSNDAFEFDRKLDSKDNRLGFEYSNYLYDINSIKKWLNKVTIYRGEQDLFSSFKIDENINFNEAKSRKKKVEIQLQRLSNLDKTSIAKRRTEQYILREFLIGGKDLGLCAICNNEYPIKLLATAHIKKRAKCSESEKKDLNVVMPTCHFGCDKLFEEGYIIVKEGLVKNNLLNKTITAPLKQYLDRVENNTCDYYTNQTKKYFIEHEKSHV